MSSINVPKFKDDIINNNNVDKRLKYIVSNSISPTVSHIYDDIETVKLYKFKRELTNKQIPYFNRNLDYKKACHWGQLKLLLSEIEFLTICMNKYESIKDKYKKIIFIYIGAAPGNHIDYLQSLFPNIEFHLYDKSNFIVKNKDIFVYNEYFTKQHAESWLFKKITEKIFLIFNSDIRRTPATNEIVKEDMNFQLKCYNTMKPNLSMFKFRLPYDDDYTEYPEGIILPQCFFYVAFFSDVRHFKLSDIL